MDAGFGVANYHKTKVFSIWGFRYIICRVGEEEEYMDNALTSRNEVVKHQTIRVPHNIKLARVEILTFRGAPAFIGTPLAKLYWDDQTTILSSKMSGVVDRILIDPDQMVTRGQILFELRNINVVRDKSRNQIKPSSLPVPTPGSNFFWRKKSCNKDELGLFDSRETILVSKNMP